MISEDLLKLAFFPTVAGGMALYSGVRAHREYQGARLSRRWLSVEGTVIASRVEEIITQRKNGVQVNHRPRIRYRYAIGVHVF